MFFFFNDTATTEIYTLSLHDALPICVAADIFDHHESELARQPGRLQLLDDAHQRSEEHTSELQSRQYLVCRLLLEKKKKLKTTSLTPASQISPISVVSCLIAYISTRM